MVTQFCILVGCLLSVSLPFMTSMLSLGAALVFLALISTLVMSMSSGSWFGFITFLIYVTGLLVLFGYLLVVSPNTNKMKVLTSPKLFCSSLVLLSLYLSDFKPTFEFKSYTNTVSLKVMNIYEAWNLTVYLCMALLLFVALILAVYVLYKSPKPMRSFVKWLL